MADETSIDNDLLISLVEQKSVLWDKTTELYKNRAATQAAWKEIMMVLNPDFETREEKARQTYAKLVIQRWTHIRDNYYRSIKKIQDQKKAGNGTKTSKPYVYSKKLRFLQKIMQPNETESEMTTANKESENQVNKSETLKRSEINSIETNDTPTSIPRRRPNQNDVNPIDAKMMKFIDSCINKKPAVTNRHLSFFNGILPTLDMFEDNEVLEFQMGVLQLMKKIKSSRQSRESFNVNYGGASSSRRESLSQEYQVRSHPATIKSNTIQASLQSPHSVDSNYSDVVDYNDF